MAVDFPESVKQLVVQLRKLPGIGPRSAERMAVWMIHQRDGTVAQLSAALTRVDGEVQLCPDCGFFIDHGGCAVCSDSGRDTRMLCVVEQPTDVLSIERTGQFKGRYHVLGGKLSPLENVAPEDIRIDGLSERVSSDNVEEVILALGSDVEGEATAHYLAEMFARGAVKVTRLAQGMPAGGGLEHADPLTLMRALNDRRDA